MKKVFLGLLMAGVIFSWAGPAWAPTASATAAFSATVPNRFTVALKKQEENSACSNAALIIFDRLDNDIAEVSAGVDKPDGAFMYAPYRSIKEKNWHVVDIAVSTKGNDISLKVDSTSAEIKNNLKVWFGGFYVSGSKTSTGTKSEEPDGWKPMGTAMTVPAPFIGTCPFNYQLNLSGLESKVYAGSVTFTISQ